MYARLVRITVGAADRPAMERLADASAPRYRTLKGFKGVTFLADEAQGQYGSLSLWESREDAEAAGQQMGPSMQQAVAGIAKGPPVVQVFEVYEPQG